MTPAEFKTRREALGLSGPQVARMSGYAERYAALWDAGQRKVPPKVQLLLQNLEEIADRAVNLTVDTISNTSHHAPTEICLLRYRTDEDLHRYRQDMAGLPASFHASILWRLWQAFSSLGVTCRLVYMCQDEYEAWLESTGQEDSETARAAWAALQEK